MLWVSIILHVVHTAIVANRDTPLTGIHLQTNTIETLNTFN